MTAQALDLVPFVQYGALGVVVVAFVMGWLVPRHVVDAQRRSIEDRAREVDALQERLNLELMPEADRLTAQYRELVGTLSPTELENVLVLAPELAPIADVLKVGARGDPRVTPDAFHRREYLAELREHGILSSAQLLEAMADQDEVIPIYEPGSYAPRRSLLPPPEPPRAGEPTMNLLEGAEPFPEPEFDLVEHELHDRPVKRPDPTIVTDGWGRRVRPIPEGRTEVVGGRRTRPAGPPPRGYRLMRWIGNDFPGLFHWWLERRIMEDYDRRQERVVP